MSLLLKPLSRLIFPVLLLLIAAYLLDSADLISEDYQQLLTILPYGLMAAVLGLAHFYNRARFFCSALLMTSAYWLIQSQLQTSLEEASSFYIYTSLSVLLPLGLLMVMLLPEKGLWNRQSLILFSVTPLLWGAAWLVQPSLTASQIEALQLLLAIKPSPNYMLSVIASFWFGLASLAGLSLLAQRNSEVEASLTGCMMFSYTTLAFFDQPMISSLMFSAAAISLVIGLLRSSFEMAYRDDLTGLLGRRALNEKLRGLGRHYSIAMLDIDHFKKFNDSYGHDVGDDVLKIVANHIAQVSGSGIPYRYGGEEFCIIFPGKKLKSCTSHLEAVREEIADYKIALRDKKTRPKISKEGANNRSRKAKPKTVSVTISIGIAQKSEQLNQVELVLKAADKALYQAKQKGRNCLAF
jgi:diguanylate cyclase (GGDEF)-like protein